MGRDLSPLWDLLRCLDCGSPVELVELIEPGEYPELGPDGLLECTSCACSYPVIAGTARMLRSDAGKDREAEADVKLRTAESFAYEWQKFGGLREEWQRNFVDYMRPNRPEWLEGKLVLDVGAGSGRHSHEARRYGARVVAVDLGNSIDVARRNLPSDVLTVQADAERLPFDEGAFELVMALGVIHHLPDPDRGLRAIARHARPGGRVQVYVYWVPEWRSHRAVLAAVTAVRRLTVRMPHWLLHILCYPLAAALMALVVVPHRAARALPALEPLARRLPLKAYADYPFGVLVNDQFDRFSAPIEHRYEADEVERMLRAAGLEDVRITPSNGWLGSARRPS